MDKKKAERLEAIRLAYLKLPEELRGGWLVGGPYPAVSVCTTVDMDDHGVEGSTPEPILAPIAMVSEAGPGTVAPSLSSVAIAEFIVAAGNEIMWLLAEYCVLDSKHQTLVEQRPITESVSPSEIQGLRATLSSAAILADQIVGIAGRIRGQCSQEPGGRDEMG